MTSVRLPSAGNAGASMIEKVFRGGGVFSADRFGAWRKRLGREVSPQDSGGQADGFRSETRLLRLGAARVWSTVIESATVRRTPQLVRRSDPRVYTVVLPLAGGIEASQVGRKAVHGPFDMHVLDSSQPFHLRLFGSPLVHLIGADVPTAGFPLPARKMDQLLIQRLPGREGPGTLLSGFLIGVFQNPSSYRPSDGPRLEAALRELLTAVSAHHLHTDDIPQRALALRIQEFIRQHLADPELAPSTIAAAHNISLSHLHRTFQAENITVSSSIREQRLSHARRDLADPALQDLSVREIALRWGFSYHSSFTRAFRAAYGVPPQDYRQLALSL